MAVVLSISTLLILENNFKGLADKNTAFKVLWTSRPRSYFSRNLEVILLQFQLFETCYFSVFGLIFPQDWLQRIQITCAQGGETDSWLRNGSSLGAFPSQPVMAWWHPFSWRLKRVGESHTGGCHPHSEPVPDPLRTSFCLDYPPETLICLGSVGFSWLPHTFVLRKLCCPYTPSVFTFYFPGDYRRHLFVTHCPSSGQFYAPMWCTQTHRSRTQLGPCDGFILPTYDTTIKTSLIVLCRWNEGIKFIHFIFLGQAVVHYFAFLGPINFVVCFQEELTEYFSDVKHQL